MMEVILWLCARILGGNMVIMTALGASTTRDEDGVYILRLSFNTMDLSLFVDQHQFSSLGYRISEKVWDCI